MGREKRLCVTDKKLLISVYMPYFNSDNNPSQLVEYKSTLGFIEDVLDANPGHKYILFMDMNCNIFNGSHPYSDLINEMMSTHDLKSSFDFSPDFNPNHAYTRFDSKRIFIPSLMGF